MILKRKLIVLLALIILCTLFFYSISFAATNSLIYMDGNSVWHYFYPCDQEETYWCWAACAEMSGEYYYGVLTNDIGGVDRTQTQIVTYVKGTPPPNDTATPQEMVDAFDYAGWKGIPYDHLYSTSYISATSFSYSIMKGFVNLHKPTFAGVILHIGGFISGLHALVVYAYDDKTSSSSDDSIKLADPATGSYTGWITYIDLVSGFPCNGYTGVFGTISGQTSHGVYID